MDDVRLIKCECCGTNYPNGRGSADGVCNKCEVVEEIDEEAMAEVEDQRAANRAEDFAAYNEMRYKEARYYVGKYN